MSGTLFTGRNEVVAKVIFLHVSVIHSVHRGGGGLPQCMLGYPPDQADPPPQTRQTPPGPGRPPQTRQTPPDQTEPPTPTPPWTRQTPPPLGPGRPPWDKADPPQTRQTPRTRQTPPDQADPPGPGRHPLQTRQTPPQDQADPPDQADTSQTRQTAPPRSRLQHTVNERPVRILLECILVS